MIRPLPCSCIPLHGGAVFALVIDRAGNRSKPQSGTLATENTMSEIPNDARFCCDLKRLNIFTIPDTHPAPEHKLSRQAALAFWAASNAGGLTRSFCELGLQRSFPVQ